MQMEVNLSSSHSNIYIERGILHHIREKIDGNCKVMVITDEGVPAQYSEIVCRQFPNSTLYVTVQGEKAKSFEVYEAIIRKLLELNFTRKDMILALGGGVIGDLSGFVAATFKRGMRFASIPTTTLSQIDSSIGGKVAINVDELKNMVGTFYHPEAVFIDIDTCKTLSARHVSNGLVEAVKAGLIGDEKLFELFETENIEDHLEEIITHSLMVKKKVVEEDEKETHLRKILNFGHTIGHAIESYNHLHDYCHGECVAMGMMAVLENKELKERLRHILEKMQVPVSAPYDPESLLKLIQKDKKVSDDHITLVLVEKCGQAELKEVSMDTIRQYLKGEAL